MASSSQPVWRRLTHGPRERQALAFLRIATGLFLLYLGLCKLNTPNMETLLAESIKIWASKHPQPVYQAFLETVVLPNAAFFTHLVTWSEILIGGSYILGGFIRYSALVGLFLNINFLLATQHMGADALGINIAFLLVHTSLWWSRAGSCFGLDSLIPEKLGGVRGDKAASTKRLKVNSLKRGRSAGNVQSPAKSRRRKGQPSPDAIQAAVSQPPQRATPPAKNPKLPDPAPPKPPIQKAQPEERPIISPKIRDLRDS